MKELKVLSERNGKGFKIMYPNIYGLKDEINPNPKTREEAIKNKEINERIKQWGKMMC